MVVKDMDKGMWTRGAGRAAAPGANWTPELDMVDMVVRDWAQGKYATPESGRSIWGKERGAGATGKVWNKTYHMSTGSNSSTCADLN